MSLCCDAVMCHIPTTEGSRDLLVEYCSHGGGKKYIAKQNSCEITSKCNFDHKSKRLNIYLKDSTARETMWSTLEALQNRSNMFRLFPYSNVL